MSDQAKAILFLLFLFGIGYSVGPSFFQTFKGDGWRWMLLGVFVPVIGLLAAYSVAHFLKLDVGYSAGLLSGSLTESPAIGTASEAINALSLPDEQKQQLIGHIAVADAICYIFGTWGVIWCCGTLGPKLLGIDLREESKNVEASLGIQRKKLGVSSAWQPIGFHAYLARQGRISRLRQSFFPRRERPACYDQSAYVFCGLVAVRGWQQASRGVRHRVARAGRV